MLHSAFTYKHGSLEAYLVAQCDFRFCESSCIFVAALNLARIRDPEELAVDVWCELAVYDRFSKSP